MTSLELSSSSMSGGTAEMKTSTSALDRKKINISVEIAKEGRHSKKSLRILSNKGKDWSKTGKVEVNLFFRFGNQNKVEN